MDNNFLWNRDMYRAVQAERDRQIRQRSLVELALQGKRERGHANEGGLVSAGYRWLKAQMKAPSRRRLRRAIERAAAQLHQSYPEWTDFLFDTHFLLDRGLPIIERHIEGAASTDAFDLALAWAEQWPHMSAVRRKSRLQTLTPSAAEFLSLLEKELVASRRTATGEGVAGRYRRVRAMAGALQPNR